MPYIINIMPCLILNNTRWLLLVKMLTCRLYGILNHRGVVLLSITSHSDFSTSHSDHYLLPKMLQCMLNTILCYILCYIMHSIDY